MALETKQNFLKGINRRFPREESTDPDFFYTLQNARLFTRGETGKVTRIPGFTQFNQDAADYSKVLDSIKYNDKYIVLYENTTTADQFHVTVFNSDGTVDFTDNYSGTSTSSGSLLRSGSTIYISPHSKVLYDDAGTWSLQDFDVDVPIVDTYTQDTGNKATASIEPTSQPSNAPGSVARGRITVIKNNTAYGETDSAVITVGSDSTSPIAISYNDTAEDIAKKFYDELINTTAITNNWNISMQGVRSGVRTNARTIFLDAKTTGNVTDEISISWNFGISADDFRSELDENRPSFREKPERFRRKAELFRNLTTLIQQPEGGDSGTSQLGPLYMRFENIGKTVPTENIVPTDTITQVANKIETALTNDSDIVENFNISRTGDKIDLTAKEEGKRYNGKLLLRFSTPGFIDAKEVLSYNKSDFSGGLPVEENLNLKTDTNYWYKARYKYVDGQVSAACYPFKINTGPSKGVDITFLTDHFDLDGTRPRLQIFRREEGESFYLIDEIDVAGTTTQYNDDGQFEKGEFNEIDSIFTKQYRTHEIVDNRVVRANVTYKTDRYTEVTYDDGVVGTPSFDVDTTTVSSGNETLPNNSKVRLFVQPQYEDGSRGYFQEIGFQDIKSPDKILTVSQNEVLDNVDKEIRELAFYANYQPHGEEFLYNFNSMELANQNVPTIEDDSRFPSDTQIFLGFRYILLQRSDSYAGGKESINVSVYGWDTEGNEEDHQGFRLQFEDISGPIDGTFPETLDIDILGNTFTYVRIGTRSGTNKGEGVYELADAEALKKAAETGDLIIKMTSSNINGLSSTRSDDEIVGQEFKVKNIIDKSEGYERLSIHTEDDQSLQGPPDTRMYLEIEESPLDDIDNTNVTNYWFDRNYETYDELAFIRSLAGIPTDENDTISYNLSFQLVNFKKLSDASLNPYSGEGSNTEGGRQDTGEFDRTFYRYDWDMATYELTSRTFIDNDNVALYVGKKSNQDDAGAVTNLDITGFDYEKDGALHKNVLRKDAVYQTLFFSDDINLDKTKYGNQLIWSDELNATGGFSGGRNFRNEAFFNISDENGDILEVMSLANRLYVFCEEGIAVVNIGEVLTTQKQGEVFVDSSRFMTNYYWINDKVINVNPKSIVKYKNVIYFTDGFDVYALSPNGMKNISQGVLDLDPTNTYYAGINPEHDEYQLCDYNNTETWVYNIPFQQWYGPFTYGFKTSVYNGLQHITIDDVLYEQGVGNTFGGSPYTTKIENAANDTERSFIDKNFRKFYIQTQNDTNATFEYGKDPQSLVSVNFSNMVSKNGYKHQGVSPSEGNAKSIFWTISSDDDGFELSDISWKFSPSRRR